ncbi:MAG: hypothetical protein AAF636_16750 [Pseudomonadota bacterium]
MNGIQLGFGAPGLEAHADNTGRNVERETAHLLAKKLDNGEPGIFPVPRLYAEALQHLLLLVDGPSQAMLLAATH